MAAGVSAFDEIYRRWSRLSGSSIAPFTLGELVESLAAGKRKQLAADPIPLAEAPPLRAARARPIRCEVVLVPNQTERR